MLYMAASSLLIREKATSENHFVTPPPIKLIMTLIIDIQVILLGVFLLLKNK